MLSENNHTIKLLKTVFIYSKYYYNSVYNLSLQTIENETVFTQCINVMSVYLNELYFELYSNNAEILINHTSLHQTFTKAITDKPENTK